MSGRLSGCLVRTRLSGGDPRLLDQLRMLDQLQNLSFMQLVRQVIVCKSCARSARALVLEIFLATSCMFSNIKAIRNNDVSIHYDR